MGTSVHPLVNANVSANDMTATQQRLTCRHGQDNLLKFKPRKGTWLRVSAWLVWVCQKALIYLNFYAQQCLGMMENGFLMAVRIEISEECFPTLLNLGTYSQKGKRLLPATR